MAEKNGMPTENDLQKDTKHSLLNGDTVIGVCGVALGIVWIVLALQLPSLKVADGTPGPAVFPIMIAVLTIVLSLLILNDGLTKKENYFHFDTMPKGNMKIMLMTVVMFIVFLILWKYVHFIAGMFVLCLVLMIVYGRKPIPSVIFSICYAVATYELFSRVLQVMLDIGR